MNYKVEAFAPSNIAWIKYMGKVEQSGNRPTNVSLSYTVPYLLSKVIIESSHLEQDLWLPLEEEKFHAPTLSELGMKKFLNHFYFLKNEWNQNQVVKIYSANNFPADCGLASSASSFAALTKAADQFFSLKKDTKELSRLSRQGSGSSCRSFFSPWAIWKEEGAEKIEISYDDLLHAVVVIHAEKKEVSSSEAHKRVTSSPRFENRAHRASDRCLAVISDLRKGDWKSCYQVVKDEFIDMHELFETSVPEFKYRNKESSDVVDACQHIWNFKGDGPIVTMDAGPNVHLFFRLDQKELAQKMISHFKQKHIVLMDSRLK